MEINKSALIAELPGLEAARKFIEDRILEIHAQLRAGPVNYSAPKILKPLPDDPDVLGRDSLGRIKRRRNLSPEDRENRRRLIILAREKKFEKIADTKKATANGQ
jgi:hypothetical protein